MDRRGFIATLPCVVAATCAGCLTGEGSPVSPEIAFLELENHRRDTAAASTLRIGDGDDVLLEETHRLGPAGSGNDSVAIERPVERRAETVHVAADGTAAAVDVRDLATSEEPCLRLTFSLDAETLHAEHQAYQRCDRDGRRPG